MIKFIENNLVGLFLSVIILCFVIIGCLILSSNKYEDDISRLKIENKKLQHKEEHPECEYYIHPSGDGFVIDGQLYEKVEGYEAYE